MSLSLVAQVSKPAVSPISKSAALAKTQPAWTSAPRLGSCCNLFWTIAILITLFSAFPLCAADTEPLAKTIDYLIAKVEKADDVKFLRNGDEHTGKEAAKHMRRKYDHFKKEIKTPEDFIEKCASKSELSSKPYMIKKSDGSTVKCEDWMKSLLEEHRKSPGS